jgi:4-alpha-glucanotransferase
MKKRGSGILLHITSLPSPYGIGDLGMKARDFVDFLAKTGQSYWQILPLNLTCPAYGNSPYSSFSAFAGNLFLISPELMAKEGLLKRFEINDPPVFPAKRVNYKKVIAYKNGLFDLVFKRNTGKLSGDKEFRAFCRKNVHWLDDFALFISIKKSLNGIEWCDWPKSLRDRKKGALKDASLKLKENILKEKFLQYIFFRQWASLKKYCDARKIKIIGDIPIYVNYDSSDVWANPGIFSLDKDKRPVSVAGVPPDYFSSTGQLWGHPIYKWNSLKRSGYEWWLKRIEHNLEEFHIFRLDHFRGFVGYWKVDAKEETAMNGEWIKAPAVNFFNAVMKRFPNISIIAEDLGDITPDVRKVMEKFDFPGMKVLLFAFGGDVETNPYAPHNHIKNCLVYTGTHDNNTIKGWFKTETTMRDKERIFKCLGRKVTERTVHWEFVRLAMMSVAETVIIPMQDILGLGEKQRMNLPASAKGNWEWRLLQKQLSPELIRKLKTVTERYGR